MQKILVVDDEHDVCDFVRNFFQDRGFEVLVAGSGEEAIAIVKKDPPSVVLLDIKMKGMDGIATLKHLKELKRDINVIMVTALDDHERMSEASRLGAVEYITKPLMLDYLEQVIDRVVRSSGA